METKKKDYEAPDISLKRVEIESQICSGSQNVEFKGEGAGQVNIADQGVAPVTGNDFSQSAWEVPATPSN